MYDMQAFTPELVVSLILAVCSEFPPSPVLNDLLETKNKNLWTQSSLKPFYILFARWPQLRHCLSMASRRSAWSRVFIHTSMLGLGGYAVLAFQSDRYGSGIHQDEVSKEDLQKYAQLANATQIYYGPLIFITKLSILLLYLRAFAPARRSKTGFCIHSLLWFNLLFYLADTFVKIFECTPREKIWKPDIPGHCTNIKITFFVASVINVFSDVVILLLPMICVSRLQMRRAKKVGICIVFAAGIFGCVSSVMRVVVSIKNSHAVDKTYDWFPEFLWTTAEVASGIVASCLPALPSFLRHFFQKASSRFSKTTARGAGAKGNNAGIFPRDSVGVRRPLQRRTWELDVIRQTTKPKSSGNCFIEKEDQGDNTRLFGNDTKRNEIVDLGAELGQSPDQKGILKTQPPSTTPAPTVEMAAERSGIVVGLNKGHKTTPLNSQKTKISRTKGHLSKRTAFVRDIAREVAGLAPYERRVIELLRNAQDKRARKLAKKRLGTFTRGKRKVEDMQRVIAESRRAAGH
ncbi:hypothetical protein ASPZODRAFT_153585 [Penicilliopsis zonata CBS 506.65]|uniref:60S ribosomal protein L36 n=1 Tax=Penicilliopsis zonata CBS 506.65 TaxID=1073090 RepID=A0A1L9SC32_9EURO|nr:hypothetical protein ASPZODRAFT_153585 [Penicilliopsis zonata CBS 506.65]OJJ44688.1 hypothetical protein ASPZODRAFT_153585 [Penicilliopsis zonata CBS 506.65]